MIKNVLVDAREFIPGRSTGIGRVLNGLVKALSEDGFIEKITLFAFSDTAIPPILESRKKISIKKISCSFMQSELALSNFTRQGASVFISPYPKLPLFGCHCPSVHIVHDVLDLTHTEYKYRLKVFLDRLRLRIALKKASLTWYVSSWSMEETMSLIGFPGRNPKVRYSGIDERFSARSNEKDVEVLRNYGLQSGYILVLGNGKPHKNLGVVLDTFDRHARRIVFVGVPKANQKKWKKLYPLAKTSWIKYAPEEELPSIIRGAFCLAQPSTAEGYGYPPLEAMACGVPAVISNIPVLIETTNGHALSADPYVPKDWIEAFEGLEDKEIYTSRVEMGLKWVERFQGPKGWKDHLSDIENLVER
jgi:glycosyltransferase involved in cell wall biosynthesis